MHHAACSGAHAHLHPQLCHTVALADLVGTEHVKAVRVDVGREYVKAAKPRHRFGSFLDDAPFAPFAAWQPSFHLAKKAPGMRRNPFNNNSDTPGKDPTTTTQARGGRVVVVVVVMQW